MASERNYAMATCRIKKLLNSKMYLLYTMIVVKIHSMLMTLDDGLIF